MHVVLKVLASTSIKRRKPWPRLAWIGKEKQNLLLLGDRRVSILYMPSGKTKRKISKLHALIKDCVSLTYTSNGLYVIGLLTTGDIFVWCKDSDVVSHVRGLVDLQARSQVAYKWRPKLFSSGDCNTLLVVIAGVLTTEIYLYQCKRDFGQSINTSSDESSEAWWRCGTDMEVTPLRSRVGKEMTLDVRFVTDNIFGRCCIVAFVYSCESSIHLVTLVIRWFPNNSLPVHDWHKMTLPYSQVSIDAKPVTKRGAFVTCWSHDGRILAIAVNQEATEQDHLVFVSPSCKVLYVAKLPYEYSGLRHYRWICGISWTHNDLFVITISQLGSICLLSRLGEPLSIATSGCSMDLPVSLSLNIHPFIFVKPQSAADKDSSTATADILKQRYSICCHPFLPMFLCSDGYMVTCLQFPQPLMDPFKFIDVCVHQSEKYLRVLRKCLRLADATMNLTEDYPLLASTLHKSAIQVHDYEVCNGIDADSWEVLPAENVSLSESDSSNLKSEQVLHHYSSIGKHESGTLVFGARDADGSQFRLADGKNKAFSLYHLLSDTKKETGSCLLSIWSILVTANETWTVEWEERAKKASDLLVKVCSEFLSSHPKTDNVEQVDLESSFVSVICLITDLMNRCRFSALNKSIMPIVLSSVLTVFRHLSKYAEKLPLPTQALYLVQLCNRLESVEKIFSDIFGAVGNQLLCFWPQNNLKNAFLANGPQSNSSRCNKTLLHRRFAPIWIMLYKTNVKLVGNCTGGNDTCIVLLGRLQRKLQNLGIALSLNKRHLKVENADKVLICDPYKYESAAEQWKVQVEACLEITDDKFQKSSVRVLHSILYTLLGEYHLKDVISLIYWLLTRNDALHIDRGLRHPAVRETIRSFARFMAAYFVDELLYVYPFHRPCYFPALHKHHKSRMHHRIVPVSRLKLTQTLSNERVAYHWTVDVMIALFLSSGYINEAARIVHRLGDWKTAFVLFYASQIGRESKSSKLMSERILESRLLNLLKSHCSSQPEVQRMTSSLQNLFLAGAICDVDVTTLILNQQVQELQSLVRQLPLIVPMDVYLPHPPPYCPQPSEQNHSPVESIEEKLRCEIARRIQLFIVVLQTLQCTTHLIHIYLSHLSSLTKQVVRAKELSYEDWPLLDLHLKLKGKLAEFQRLQPEQRQKLGVLTASFRDFCAVCWFLHVRDKMNMHLRRFWQQLIKGGAMPAKFCLNTLQWAVHLIPFAEAVGWNLDVYHLIISVLLEAPRDRRSSLILAQCFPDMSQIPTELDYRISSLLNVWRSIVVKVPSNRRQPRTTKTLSVIHLSQCDGVRSSVINLKGILGDFDKNVFNSRQTEHNARFDAKIFEIEKDYFLFLGLMFDVGIIKDNLEDDSTHVEIPLLNVFKDMQQQQYLVRTFLVHKDSFDDKDRKWNAIHEISVDAATLKEIKSQLTPTRSTTSRSKKSDLQCKRSLLFRSISLMELNQTNMKENLTNPLSGRVKSLTNLDKASARKKKNRSTDTTQILPKCSSLLSLCDAVDFDQSWTRSPRYVQMLEVLSWLVKWTKREDYTGKLIEESANIPRMKVQITYNQLVLAIHQAINISSNQRTLVAQPKGEKCDEIPLPERDLLPKASTEIRKLRKEIGIKSSFPTGEQSDNLPDKRNVLTHHHNWSENSKDRQLEVNTLTSDNSYSSLDSDFHLNSEAARVSDELTSVATSRWTNSGQLTEISSKLKGFPPSANPDVLLDPYNCIQEALIEPPVSMLSSSTMSNQEYLLSSNVLRTPKPKAASTKDFTCGNDLIWGSRLTDTGVQVNVESLAEIRIQPAKENEHFTEVDQPSTCDDTQNDACSLPITTSASEEDCLRKKSLKTNGKLEQTKQRHGLAQFKQPFSEQETRGIPVVEIDLKENKMTDFSQIRLLHLPAEKELCKVSSSKKSALPKYEVRRIPALLHLEPECKLGQKITLQAQAQPQPRILSHQEVQHLQSKYQSVETRMRPDKPVTKGNFRNYSIPPLLQLDASSTSIQSIPLHEQKIQYQVAIPKTSLRASVTSKLVTKSQGVQTVAEREDFTMASSSLVPKKLAFSSQGILAKAQRGPYATTSSPQTFGVVMKHTSTLTDNLQMQHASTITDAPRTSESIGINTSLRDEVSLDGFSIKYPLENSEKTVEQPFPEILSVTQATQTEEPNRREELKNIHSNTVVSGELHRTDNGSKIVPASDFLNDQKRKSGRQNDLNEKIINYKTRTLQIHSAGDKGGENVVDLKMMRERLNRLQNEGLLNDDTLPIKVKNLQSHHERLTIGSINTQVVKISPHETYLLRKPAKEPSVGVKVTHSSMQLNEFKNQRESLEHVEKKPFVCNDGNIVKINSTRAEERRKNRQSQMHSNHYETRKNEAVKLMQELVQAQEAAVCRRPVQLRRSQPVVNKCYNATNRISSVAKQNFHENPSATYVLSNGLRPVQEMSKACPRSLPASPSRKKIAPSNFVSCPTSPKNPRTRVRQTTYIERLQALQPPKLKDKGHLINSLKSQDCVQLQSPMPQTPDFSTSSDTSTCETLSPWIVPDEVKQLLFGKAHRSKVCRKSNTRVSNENINSPSDSDTGIDWEEIGKIVELHQVG